MPLKSRRAGHGCSSGVAVAGPTAVVHRVIKPANLVHFGDDPRIAAALHYARLDIAAYEQSEAYWLSVWGES